MVFSFTIKSTIFHPHAVFITAEEERTQQGNSKIEGEGKNHSGYRVKNASGKVVQY